MRKTLEILATAGVAVGLLVLADQWLQPVPIPAATAIVAGIIFVWLRRPRYGVALGLTIGTLVGVMVHLVVHASGRSPSPAEGVLVHVATDGVRGFGVAVLLMVPVVLLQFVFSRFGAPSAGRDDGSSSSD